MYAFVIFILILGIDITFSQTIRTTYICPEGFKSIGRKCYYFSKQSTMWTDSHFYCQILNSTLLVFNSLREQHLLKGFITQDNHATVDDAERWIDGIYDWQEEKWKWGSNGRHIADNTFTRRNKGDQFRWNCIALNGAQNNKWIANRCTEKKPFICETETNVFVEFKLYNKKKRKFNITKCSSGEILEDYEKRRCIRLLGRTENEPESLTMDDPKKLLSKKRNHDGWVCPSHMISLANRCYFFSTTEATFMDAHFECRRNDSKLAMVKTKMQDYNLRIFLNNFIERHDRWIGGIYDWRTTKWRWAMTSQPLTYRGFNSAVLKRRQPESLVWNSIYMDPKLDNQWNAANQMEKKHFICQVRAKGVKSLGRKKRKRADATITILKAKKRELINRV